MRRIVDGVFATALLCAIGIVAGDVVVTASELPAEWRNWSHSREIEFGVLDERSLVRVAIPEALFEEARSDLADLRVVDATGETVGYVLFQRGTGPETAWRPTELSDVGFVPGSHTQLVADTGDEGALHNAVEVTLPQGEGEFFAWVEVAASPDGETWRIVRARAPLYRFRQRGFGRTVSISYPRTRDRWLRLRLRWQEEEVAVERLRVAERLDEDRELTRLRRSLTRNADSPAGESWWEAPGDMPEVPIAAVRVATSKESFHRPVTVSASEDGSQWRQVGAGNIFRFPPEEAGEGSPESMPIRQSLLVDVRHTASRLWRVTVFDRGDPPIADLTVSLMQNRRYVVFQAEPGGSYRLAYGNPRAEAPEYELASLTSRDALTTATLATLGASLANEGWVSGEPFTERHPVILWAALGLVVLVLGGMALRVLRT